MSGKEPSQPGRIGDSPAVPPDTARGGIRQVARLAGVSISTVSRALNGYADVNVDTRAKVAAAAESLGYRPSWAAAMLRRAETRTVTFMVSKPWTRFMDPYFLGVLDGLEQALSAGGYDLQVVMAREYDREFDTIRRIVASARCDALVFARTRPVDERVDFMKSTGLPFATVGRTIAADHDWIDRDNETMGRMGVERLVALGHRRIALLSAPLRYTYAHQMRAGVRAALRDAAIDPDPALEVECYLSRATGAEAVTQLFVGRRRTPTALLCGNDMIAMSAMEGLTALGLTPGHDIAVIGAEDMPLSAYATPPLTTFSVNLEAMGLRLGRMVLSRLAGEVGPLQELVPSRLVIRASDGPLRADSAG
jgi:LacI family transcriptional regulator